MNVHRNNLPSSCFSSNVYLWTSYEFLSVSLPVCSNSIGNLIALRTSSVMQLVYV